MRTGNQMLERLTAAAAVALGWRTAFSPDLISSLNIQMDTPRNCKHTRRTHISRRQRVHPAVLNRTQT